MFTGAVIRVGTAQLQYTDVHCVRGQSGFFNLAQTEGNMQIKLDLKLSVHSLGVDI